jgi:hypothetical protein
MKKGADVNSPTRDVTSDPAGREKFREKDF